MQQTLKKSKAQPKPETLAEFWQAANITDTPSWARQVGLARFPFQHQIEDLNHLAQNVRSGLWSEPGTGKTFPSQAHVLWLVSMGNRALCVMPPVLVPQFLNSFHANFLGIGAHVSIATFAGDVATRNQMMDEWDRSGWPQVLIMSNDLFCGKSEKEIANLINKRVKAAEKKGTCPTEARKLSAADSAGPELWLKKGFTHIMVDEATSVKTPSSSLHKAVKKFVGKDNDQSNGLVLMTGSPIENNLTDAYGLIALLTPSRYGSYRSFERIHCLMTYGRFPQIYGYANQSYCWESLFLKGRRITKKEAIDLPPRLVSEIQVDLADPHIRLYKKLVTERVLELGDSVIDATTASSLYQKVQRMLVCPESFYDGDWKTENTLLTSLDELIHSLGGRKLLLFCWYTESIRKLTERYKHLNPAMLYGETTGKEREQMKAKFINDDSCKLMIMNPRSGGVGVDGLQAVCSHVAFVEMVSTPGLLEQAISRLHRSGQQHESVTVYFFVCRGTVSVKLRNNLVAKERDANAVVRDQKTLLSDLLGSEGIVGSLD